MGQLIDYAVSDGLATITLNRPDAANAINDAMKGELLEVLTLAAAEPGVRALLLGARGKAFSVGQDLAEHAETLKVRPDSPLETVADHYNPITLALAEFPRPVVVAIGGACVGAALGFALAADLRVAGESAKFGTAFAGIGLGPDSGLSVSLARTVGVSRATELLLLPNPITAHQAREWGLVNHLVADESVDDEARALAERLAVGPTAAYAEIKRILRANADVDLPAALAAEAEMQQRLGRTEDHRAAVAAFLAKQQPTFNGS